MKQLRPILLILFALLPSLLSAQENNPLINSGELISKGIQLHDDGKYKDAVSLFRQVSRSDTNYVLALYELSLSYSADSQHTKAIAVCEEALSMSQAREREPELYNQLANLIDDTGNPKRALQIYDSAIAKYPAFSSLYVNKGTSLIKLERFSEAESVLKNALLIDPYSASSHYMLGLAALNQGKVVPAFISFFSYLMMAPHGRYSRNSINLLSTIAKNKDELQSLMQNRKEDAAAPYQLLEQILLSKIALDKNYKPIIKLDDVISRQIQVLFEKMTFDESDKDFWMQYYIPLYKNIYSTNQFEHFINYIFSGVDVEMIRNYNKKNKKEIEALVEEMVKYLNNIRSTREIEFTKREKTNVRYLFEDDKLTGKGTWVGNHVLVGPWQFYFPAGNTRSTGQFNDKGEREGSWSYYYYNGQTKAKESYSNGKLEGEIVFYHENGNISSRVHYHNDELHGLKTTWFLSGAIRLAENYKNGKLDGERKIYFNNGTLHTIENYSGDSLNGVYKSYFQNGQLETMCAYNNGAATGVTKGYHENGKPAFEGQYNNDKMEGTWKRYFDNGQLKSVEHYVNGLLEGEYEEYYKNGKQLTKYNCKKGKITGECLYYDDDGKRFSILTFDNDLLKTARYFDKTGNQVGMSEARSKKMELTAYRPDGTKRLETSYNEKGESAGRETYFYYTGKISETNQYEKGMLNGASVVYHPNGKKSIELNYVDGEKDGYYRSYSLHGDLQNEGWYRSGQAEGNWMVYDVFGNLTSKASYYNDEMHGYKEEFWPDGKIESVTEHQYGWIKNYIQYDTTGKIIHRVNLEKGTGKFTMLHFNGKIYAEGNYVEGSFEGPYTFYYFDGSRETSMFYKKGLIDSIYRHYYFGGKVHIEGSYKLGDKSGTWKYYNENGSLSYSEEYVNGKLNGKRVYYHDNGKMDSEITMEDDKREGLTRKFDTEGNLIYQLTYDDNLPVSFTYLDKNGKLLPEIPLQAYSGKVITYYSNGNKSAAFEYADGKLVGPDQLYHANGKLMRESTEDYNDWEGPFKEYYPSGQLKGEYNYVHDNIHGSYKEYNEKGILTEEGTRFNGSNHGIIRYYDNNGKLKETRHYYFGKLLSVEK